MPGSFTKPRNRACRRHRIGCASRRHRGLACEDFAMSPPASSRPVDVHRSDRRIAPKSPRIDCAVAGKIVEGSQHAVSTGATAVEYRGQDRKPSKAGERCESASLCTKIPIATGIKIDMKATVATRAMLVCSATPRTCPIAVADVQFLAARMTCITPIAPTASDRWPAEVFERGLECLPIRHGRIGPSS